MVKERTNTDINFINSAPCVIGERERAYLVVSTADFSLYYNALLYSVIGERERANLIVNIDCHIP